MRMNDVIDFFFIRTVETEVVVYEASIMAGYHFLYYTQY